MKTSHSLTTRLGRGVGGATLATLVLLAGVARSDSESCREWRHEHRSWKTEVLRHTLHGAPQREIDAAVFELLQREAWLTSCDVPVRGGRDELVGWRLVGRLPDEYGSAVVESVLERAGFGLDMREVFERPGPGVKVRPKRRIGGGRVAAR